MVQRIGEIQAALEVANGGFECRTVFDLDMLECQQVLEDPAHIGGGVAIHTAQYPFEFEHHGLGDEKRAAALDQLARGFLLRAGRAAEVIE